MFGFKKRSVPDTTRRSAHSIAPRPASVFLYHAARDKREGNDNRQPELLLERERSMHDYGRRTLVVIGLIIVFGLLGNATLLQTKPRVVVLGSLTDQTLLQDTMVYQDAAMRLLSASAANRNKLTIDTNTVATTLQAKYPELASVSITIPLLGSTPQVEIQPAVPIFMLKTSSGSAFVIANSGRALALASTVQQLVGLHLPIIDDQSGLSVKVGTAVLPRTNVDFLQLVLRQFQTKHLDIVGMTLPKAQSELDVRLADKPYVVKFNFEADAKQQIGTFFAANTYLAGKRIAPGQYIDVRVPGRMYYK